MLQVDNLKVAYNGAAVINGVSLHINYDESVALIGPNGAGKTTIGRAIAGLVPYQGQIQLMMSGGTTSLKHLAAWAIARSGIVYISESTSIYESLSVACAVLSTARAAKSVMLTNLYAHFPFLRDRSEQRAGTLSGGQKKLLAIARGLFLIQCLKTLSLEHPGSVGAPLFPLLILDEPSHGLSPQALDTVRQALRDLNVAFLLIEQMARFALNICRRAYVLRNGVVVMSDFSEAVCENALLRSYLGLSADRASTLWTKS